MNGLSSVFALSILAAAAAIGGDPSPETDAGLDKRPAESFDPSKFHHGLAYLEPLEYGPDFAHFDWVSPDAIKGGRLRLGAFGRFDTLHPLNGKGREPRGVATWGHENYIYDRLLEPTADAPASYYARLAREVALLDDRVTFRLRPEARFHDGVPIVADDVKFTFDSIKADGDATLRMIFRGIDRAQTNGDHEISFFFGEGTNRLQLAILLSQLYALPRHFWAGARLRQGIARAAARQRTLSPRRGA